MATMRSGLETWLKQDCVEAWDALNNVAINAAAASFEAYTGHPNVAETLVKSTGVAIGALNFDVLPIWAPINSDRSKMVDWINDAINGKNVGDNMKFISNLAQKVALEKLVECQCGKMGSRPPLVIGARVRILVGAYKDYYGTVENVTLNNGVASYSVHPTGTTYQYPYLKDELEKIS